MFPLSLSFGLVLLGALSSVQAAITILYPTSDTVWYKNSTVSLNWTTTAHDSDTYFFRALLSNADQSVLSGNHSIADSTNATADFVQILLPGLTDAGGYVVNFVNTSNENQVFATSQPFQVAEGIVATSTVASTGAGTGTGSSASSATVEIPNANTETSTNDPFATMTNAATSTSTSTAKSSGSPSASASAFGPLGVLAQGGIVVALVAVGITLAL